MSVTRGLTSLLASYAPLVRLGGLVLALAMGPASAQTGVEDFSTEDFSSFDAPFETVTPMTVVAGEPGARVYLDDSHLGQTGPGGMLHADMEPGPHRLRVEKEGFTPATTEITVTEVSEIVTLVLGPKRCIPCIVFWCLVAACALSALALALVNARHSRAAVRFDRYDVVRPLGRGGMATVFLAYDRTLRRAQRRPVALKVMEPDLAQDEDLVRKFVKEGEALQRIAHTAPHAPVVRAFRYGREHGQPAGRPFVALEYVAGTTLLQTVQAQGRLPIRHALAVARQVAEGLAAAHAQGIWHRDVSPDNVLVTGYDESGPTVKLIDFGVAKHEYTQAHTLDGSIAGKPAYMSPEQCRGEVLDGRSDLYALGVMLYALLSGRPPFTDPNPLLVMRMHETMEPPPLPSDVPEPVRALVRCLLSKRCADRPPSAGELVVRLAALEQSSSAPPPPLPHTTMNTPTRAALLLAALLLTGLPAAFAQAEAPTDASSPNTPATMPPLNAERVRAVFQTPAAYTNTLATVEGRVVRYLDPAPSVDGAEAVRFYVVEGDFGEQLFVRTSQDYPKQDFRYRIRGVMTLASVSGVFAQPTFFVSEEWRRQIVTDPEEVASGETRTGTDLNTETTEQTRTPPKLPEEGGLIVWLRENGLMAGGIALAVLALGGLGVALARSLGRQPEPLTGSSVFSPPEPTPSRSTRPTPAPAPTPAPVAVPIGSDGAATGEPMVVEDRNKTIKFHRPANEQTVKVLPGRFRVVNGLADLPEVRFFAPRGRQTAEISFGRATGRPYEHIQLTPRTVSSRQAKLVFDGGRYTLVNHASRDSNPTHVNGRELTEGESVPLTDGDHITMGEVEFQYQAS